MSLQHLQRYVNEFAGRHNIRDWDTIDQMSFIARGFIGKRLKYDDLMTYRRGKKDNATEGQVDSKGTL